jgi:hypothetical protein
MNNHIDRLWNYIVDNCRDDYGPELPKSRKTQDMAIYLLKRFKRIINKIRKEVNTK